MAKKEQARQKGPLEVEEQVRLERMDRGSALYYEVGRRGKWLVIRNGHVGLEGSTRMREYPTEAAASTAMERIVEDRRKEGWHDPPAAGPPAGEAATGEEAGEAQAKKRRPSRRSRSSREAKERKRPR
jgi:predicted DNA-binding WGR domain protein